MTVRLFQRTRFRGDSAIIGRDEDDLADLPLGRNPSSMTMGEHDAVLLFSRSGWRGGVMYRRGRNHIDNLGSRRAGGRMGFGNTIASVRITPFFVRFNATVVTQSDGTLPGGFASSDEIAAHLQAMVAELNAWYDRERVLLRADVAHINQRDHDERFDLSITEAAALPAPRDSSPEIALIVVNSFEKASAAGRARSPRSGKVTITALRSGGPRSSCVHPAYLATSVAHEVGHFLGSAHGSATGDGTNIMTQGLQPIGTQRASVDQIQQWHRALSRNPTRRARA
jgi:hypothetical protein